VLTLELQSPRLTMNLHGLKMQNLPLLRVLAHVATVIASVLVMKAITVEATVAIVVCVLGHCASAANTHTSLLCVMLLTLQSQCDRAACFGTAQVNCCACG
jgi:hypothetical protein